MFEQLTKYLVEYKTLGIPEVGGFTVVHEPARLDIAEKLIFPPSYRIEYNDHIGATEHQLQYLSSESGKESNLMQDEVFKFGKQLKYEISSKGFRWNGIGSLQNSSTVSFQLNQAVNLEGLQPIVANKVLRDNAQHTVLIGETEVTRGTTAEETVAKKKLGRWTEIAGWILVVLAIAFIIYYLYNENFKPLSSGIRQKAVPERTSN